MNLAIGRLLVSEMRQTTHSLHRRNQGVRLLSGKTVGPNGGQTRQTVVVFGTASDQ